MERFDVQTTEASEANPGAWRPQFAYERSSSTFTAALVAVGDDVRRASDVESPGGKLTLLQAWVAMFCTAFGAGVAFVGWYPKLAGFIGFPCVALVIALSAAMAEFALYATSQSTKATSFADLCKELPQWTSKATSISLIAWNGPVLLGLYTQFIYSFCNNQILQSSFPESGLGALGLYGIVGFAVFLVTSPTSFGGPVMKFLTWINLTATWTVIVFAIVKGMCVVASSSEAVQTAKPVSPRAFVGGGMTKVAVLLSGSMFQCACVPALNYETIPTERARASWIVPMGVLGVQYAVFVFVGTLGFLAVGAKIRNDGDVFATYYETTNDWMVMVLQGGIALLMFLSTPLLGLPAKAELWGCVRKLFAQTRDVAFQEAPLLWQLGINAAMVLPATLGPCMLGKVRFMSVVTIAAGTASNWINLFLPGFVILFAQVHPLWRQNGCWKIPAAQTVWIFVLATVSAVSSIEEIWRLFAPAQSS